MLCLRRASLRLTHARRVIAARAHSSQITFLCVSTLLLTASTVCADTINFDDIDASAGDVVLNGLNPYHGFTWTNVSVYTNTPGFPGFNNSIVSSSNAAYASGDALGSPIISTITAASPFNFVSGYFGSGWYNGLTVTLNGLYNGAQTFSQSVAVNVQGAQFFAFNFTYITELDIFSSVKAFTTDPYGCGPSGCSQVTLDDLTLTPASAPPPPSTPEPMTFLLAGIGFFALAALRLKLSRTVSK